MTWYTFTSGHTRQPLLAVTSLSLSPGDGPKPVKGLGSTPDLELLLRSSQPEEDDNGEEEKEYFVAQG